MNYYLAIDIGASSGRHIVGWMEDGSLQTKEVYRFPNGVVEQDGHLCWDTEELLRQVKAGVEAAKAEYPTITSLSVDTWGVDYVLLRGDEPILPVYAYRDSRTEAVVPKVHEKLPFPELYARTGIQFQSFNTIYQLCADQEAGRLQDATDFLMIPEYLMYRLTGVKVHEYTNATTGGMVNAAARTYDPEIIRALGLPERLFGPLSQPGTVLGSFEGIPVVLCATHDTASAVEGVPTDEQEPFLSSGTWSLLGVKSPTPITTPESLETNWSNEGGPGYIRYLKNIMGMWLVNRLRDELCPGKSFDEIVSEAEQSSFDETVDANGAAFLAPKSMKAAFEEALAVPPQSVGDYFRCAYRSLARCYGAAIAELSKNTNTTYHRLYIVGGGAKNAFLNRLTAEATGLEVIALPIEATAIGNLMVQIKTKQ